MIPDLAGALLVLVLAIGVPMTFVALLLYAVHSPAPRCPVCRDRVRVQDRALHATDDYVAWWTCDTCQAGGDVDRLHQ